MNKQKRNGFILSSLVIAFTLLLSSCGGAPGTEDEGLVNNLVSVDQIPTDVSLSIVDEDGIVSGAQSTDGVTASVQIILSNLVGHRSYAGQLIEFVVEGGVIGESCVIDSGSTCSVQWTSAVGTYPDGGSQTTIGVLAMVPNAAEPFIDDNSNGMYDEGEIIEFHYPEPFRDDNLNGTWDSGEYFFDQNQNGSWDDVNDVWDGPCEFTTGTCNSPGGIVIFATGAFGID